MIDGKDWRQLTETDGGFSYFELVGSDTDPSTGVCNETTGYCDGTLSGTDFTGWKWATLEEVASLFDTLTSSPAGTFYGGGSGIELTQVNSPWAPPAIDSDGAGADQGTFFATYLPGAGAWIQGITRTLTTGPGPIYVKTPSMLDVYVTSGTDRALTSNVIGQGDTSTNHGVWLYQESVVPVPAAVWLFGSGLLGLIGAGTRRRR